MYTYGLVERALANIHEIPPEAMSAFRGRLKHFQRLGLAPANPGKGKAISYSRDNVFLWAFALELTEFGMDPTVIKAIWALEANSLLQELADNQGGDLNFYFHPKLMSHGLSKDLLQTADKSGIPYGYERGIAHNPGELNERARTADAKARMGRFWGRSGMINVSELGRRVDEALLQVAAGE